MFHASFFKNKGFTLVEILVVLAITVILSGVILANYRLGEQDFILQRVAYKLAQDTRRVQAMAGLEELRCQKNGKFHPNYKYGYGINFKMSTDKEYILFADCDGNEKYTGKDEIVEIVDFDVKLLGFEAGAVLQSLEIDDFSVDIDKLSVVFSPPDPSVSIEGTSGEIDISGNLKAEIKISLEGNSAKNKTIIVNKIGLIDID